MKKLIEKFSKDQQFLIISVAVILMLVFYSIFFMIPIFNGVLGSFYEWNPIEGTKDFIGLGNYKFLFSSPLFWISLKNTLLFTIISVVGRTVLGLLLAVGLHSITKGKDYLRSSYFLPVIMPIVAVSIVWKWIYHPRMGLLNMFLMMFGITGENWLGNSNLALPSVLMMTIWKDVGYAVIIFMAALLNVPKSLYEAAEIDGANKSQIFFKIVLPTIKPTIIFIVITSLISYFQSFVQIFIMTKGGPGTATYVLSYLIYNEAFVRYNFGYASAVAVVLFLIIIFITVIQKKFIMGEDD
jgi:multiple sugar transport system permease protein